MLENSFLHERKQTDIAFTREGLRSFHDIFFASSHQSLLYSYAIVLEINVTPCQTRYFRLAHPAERTKHKGNFHVRPLKINEQFSDFVFLRYYYL